MPVSFKQREPVQQDSVQSIAPEQMSRQQLIAAMMEDRLDPACSIRPVMQNLLLNGHKGFNNMSDAELLDEVLNMGTFPEEERILPKSQASILPVNKA
ncbi:hypothetical protein DLP05_134 [Stenotrophomonas phage vB_SmaS_DLP_5]|uniref:Uncharacterized protein n=1 Tax=Stenotrophomonas phage vB_SmaS_DLP_5 TaxID=2044561 RepID=A0A2D2W2K9_9CAUD|nr:hypothetical protein FDJ07_gp087 [Stenotrophomonas phage vB_SmaS_DLP_5]ATS92375.1 hypothetical protein DLP05_134 [Stenotrophomonas phage vB_SmaS_DLP_5]